MPDPITQPTVQTPSPAPAAVSPEPSTPASAPESQSPDTLDDMFSSLDSGYTLPDKKPAEPTVTPAKTEPSKTATPPQTPAKKESEPKSKIAPASFREELDRVKAELKTKNDTLATLQARIAEAEAKGRDTAVLAEKAARLEEQIAKQESENRMLRHETSPEFKKQHDERFNTAAEDAKQEIESLRVGSKEMDPATGETTWKPIRQADWNKDFGTLYALPYIEAKERAKSQFGEEWDMVMTHYNELHRIDRERQRALQQERQGWEEKEKERMAQGAKQREAFGAAWTKVNSDLAEKVTDYRDEDPTDAEISKARQEGYAVFDAQPKTFQQKIIKDAHIRHRVAAFVPLKIKLRRAMEELASLKSSAKEVEDSKPGSVKRPTSNTAPVAEEDWDTAARKMMS